MNTRKIHRLLLRTNILSGIIILQIIFRILPPIIIDLPKEQIDTINTFILDTCLGIILSSLFYLLLVYIPENRKKRKIRKVVEGYLLTIVENMYRTIHLYAADNNIILEGKNKDYITYEILKQIENEHLIRFVNLDKNKSEESKNKDYQEENLNEYEEHLVSEKECILKTIDRVFQLPFIHNEDEDLLIALNELQSCRLYSSVIQLSQGDNSYIRSYWGFTDYYYLYKRFSIYKLPVMGIFKATT